MTAPPGPSAAGASAPSVAIVGGGHVLAFGAHWDDLLLGCLGTLLLLRLKHNYEVTMVVLCNKYDDSYYGVGQTGFFDKVSKIYKHLEEEFEFNFVQSSADCRDREFEKHQGALETEVKRYSRSYGDCNLILTPPVDDFNQDHALTGDLVRRHFRAPSQSRLEYEVKRYTDRHFVPNIFVALDEPHGQNGFSVGTLKVRLLAGLVLNGCALDGRSVDTQVHGAEFLFSQEALGARLLVNALDYGDDRTVHYGEGFRGRVSV